ncbi:uncharacterized protein LOC143263903 isoform X2 [Megachile rotundata]|uniref:uncharacterized protein LOC143263903 isoform X2 n=1 Tax=Megachile rotundata TaxID=143995 RepID=UPI000614CA52|nr:PREDICTED: uncharacterized protein LOC100881864 isoform X7 [Megachile rotundata]
MLGQREHRTFLSTLFYVVNVLYRCSRFPCLTIDNRLAIVTNDCYRRISIGSKLADTDVTFQSTASSLTECEEQCSKLGNVCEAFSFGVGVKGNGSCSITDRTPPFENLSTHPDYDVYVKKQWISPQCDSDYLYGSFRSETGARLTKTDETSNEQNVANTNGTSSTFIPWPFFLSVPPINAKSLSSREDTANYKLLGIYDQSINHHGRFLSGDDSRNRILDSLANRNERTASSSLFVRICHRKIQAGKKMVKLLAERVINCEKLQDCCRACAYEKSFVCRGFNHRHGTDDSRCTCELTSASYSRMDADDDFLVDTDYDYYEREQNCLPSTQFDDGSRWKNDPSEHYERTKPETWLNAKNANEDRYHVSSSAIDHHTPNRELDYGPARFQQFHYEDSLGFIPQENTRNRNVNWKQRFQNHYPDFVDHDTFPEYPVNYDKVSYSDARSPSSIKPRLENRLLFGQNRFSVSNTDEYPDGRHLNYGNAFGYNDNYVSAKKQSVHEERDQLSTTRKCSIKTITGSKLSRNVLRKTCLTHDFEQCEQLCTNETDFPCESFAYRYHALITDPTDNCLLSDLSYQNINFYTDIEPDRDYNSYIFIRDPKKIRYSKHSTNLHPSEECFSRIRSGYAIPTDITKQLLFVGDLGECQFACTRSQEFVCKSLVFKYATESEHRSRVDEREPPNCFLTDSSSEQINPVDMFDMDGAELYERNSFPYDREKHPHSYSFPLSTSNILSPGNTEESSSIRTDERCYFEHHRPCKLMPHAIISSTRTITKPECQQRCSTTRNTAATPCMSFNYIINADNAGDNCLFSDISMQDLRPNLDYVYDNGHLLYSWKDFDPYCSVPTNHFHAINVTPAAAFEKHDRPYWFTTSNRSRPQVHPFNADIPIAIRDPTTRAETTKFQFESYRHNFDHDSNNIENGSLYGSTGFERDFTFHRSKELSTFQRYTVNGYPCKNATVCQRNEITGFWSCEIEQGEHGSWDYCCEPDHRCGFSRGYHYPWCYVGMNEDQWRPCSETYYPYFLSKNRSLYRQSPKYIARHWPVIYFHEMQPPNCSMDNSNNRISYLNQRFTKIRRNRLH